MESASVALGHGHDAEDHHDERDPSKPLSHIHLPDLAAAWEQPRLSDL